MKRCLILAVMVGVMSAGLSWGDWPQYLGPKRNATSEEKGIARTWPEAGPKVLWTFPLGPGFGGAAMVGDKAYVLDRDGEKGDVMRCIGLETGKEEWSYAYDAPGKTSSHGSRSTPLVDGGFVYGCGMLGDLICIDLKTHQPVWKKHIWKDFGGDRAPMWAISQNPLLYGDLLIVAAQAPRAGVVAYNKQTGEVVWKTPALPGKEGYVSPSLLKLAGQDQIVMASATNQSRGGGGGGRPGGGRPSGRPRTELAPSSSRSGVATADAPDATKGAVIGLDPKTGKELWRYTGWQCRIPVSPVIALDDDRIFVTSGYQSGSVILKIEKKDGGFVAQEMLKVDGNTFGTHVHPPVLHQGHLYGLCTTNETRDGMVCMDLEGNVKWKTGTSPAFNKGGFILVDGLILAQDGREGLLYLIEPSPEGFKPLAKAQLLGKGNNWGALSLSDGKLLIRDQGQMKCVLVK